MEKRSTIFALIPLAALIAAILACIGPNDCGAATFSVKGFVLDKSGNAVAGATIVVESYNLTTTSNGNGFFETVPVSSLGCQPFDIVINAQDYETEKLTFNPPTGHAPDELPDEITVVLDELS